MDNLIFLLNGIMTAFEPINLLAAFSGAIMGLLVGAIPGIGSLAGTALLLPLTFKMNPTAAIIMLSALYYSNMYGGSFSAILLNIPGDSPAVMTALDGHPLAKQGKAGKALFIAIVSSFVGGMIGIVLLSILGPILSNVGLLFGPVEMTSLYIFALTSIGWLLGEQPIKGLIMTMLGVLLATVGVDAHLGQARFTFNNVNLLSGISFIPLVIGSFGLSQVFETINSGNKAAELEIKKITLKESMLSKQEMKTIAPVAIRSGLLGTFVGLLPGSGATAAAFISYIFQSKVSKDPSSFGKGNIEGLAAAEAANNAASIGSFAPMLTLGIPGSGTSAILLGGLMMWGLRPGPLLFTESPDFVWGLIGSMYIGNIICLFVAALCVPFLMNILKVPKQIMIPVITIISVVGTYSVNNSMFDVFLMIGVGVSAYALILAKYPLAPMLLAFVLTPRLETSIRQSFDIGKSDISIFIQKPISLGLLICTVIFIFAPIVVKIIKKKQKG